MKLTSVSIKNVGIIHDPYTMEFNPGLNILCGNHSTGKTTLLECIAHALCGTYDNTLQPTVNTDQPGHVEILFANGEDCSSVQYAVLSDGAITEKTLLPDYEKALLQTLYFKSDRRLDYPPFDESRPIMEKSFYEADVALSTGILCDDIRQWFMSRLSQSAEGDEACSSLSAVKSVFPLIDEHLAFSHVAENEIFLTTPLGIIPFDRLSAGQLSCLYILLGIMKELECRNHFQLEANTFEGLILIDDIDLHLSPDRIDRLLSAIKTLFPKCQFIVTTRQSGLTCPEDTGKRIELS